MLPAAFSGCEKGMYTGHCGTPNMRRPI